MKDNTNKMFLWIKQLTEDNDRASHWSYRHKCITRFLPYLIISTHKLLHSINDYYILKRIPETVGKF